LGRIAPYLHCHASGIAAEKGFPPPRENMPQEQRRWPIITTSISGVRPEIWAKFKSDADRRGLTFRLALEEAIRQLSEKIKERSGQQIDVPNTDFYIGFEQSNIAGLFRARTTTAKPHPVQMHHEVRDILGEIAQATGYKRNIVILNAMMWWMLGDHRQSP